MKVFEHRAVEILLVEDNEGDVMFTQEAFSNANIKNNIHVAKDGEEAIDFLRKQGKFEGVVTPDIVLLDLNLPKKNGKEVLQEVKGDEALRHIPIMVCTSSQAERDIVESYFHHTNSYILKPHSIESYSTIVDAIESFWFGVSVLAEPKIIKEMAKKDK